MTTLGFRFFSYILDLTHQLHEMETIAVAKGTLLKQTMADGGTDMNATKELSDPLRTTDARK